VRRFLTTLFLALASCSVFAAELRPFTADSLTAIKEKFAGRSFILTLWSTTCTHCARELRLLGKLVRNDPGLPVAIVSTDTPDDAADIHSALKRFGLDRMDTWVFADGIPERLRHAIDPAWRGELPRAYLFDAVHRREAHSGPFDEARLKNWLRQNRPGH
jgi:thiol-disulfide isomerase/thioredoxin